MSSDNHTKKFGANLLLALSLMLLPAAVLSNAMSSPALAEISKESKSESKKQDSDKSDKKDTDKKESDAKESKKENDKKDSDKKDSDKKESAKAAKTDKAKGADKDDKKKDKVDKKALKEEEKAKKVAQAKAEEEAKKSGKHGFFGFGAKPEVKGGKETKAPEPVKAVEPKPEVKAEVKPAVEKKAEEKLPDFVPDSALIALLKDINNQLKDSEEVKSMESVDEKYIVGLAQQILDKALSDPKVAANRIVAHGDESRVKSHLTAESWSSGDIEINDKFHGAISTVWAKRIGGLVTLTIAGNNAAKSPDGKPINEFIVVVTAHSPVETGFDIQSQNDVSYWKGKLDKIAVESDLIQKAEGEAESAPVTQSDASQVDGNAKKKSLNLPPLLTERYRKHYELIVLTSARRQKIAMALGDGGVPARPKTVIKRVVEVEEIESADGDGVTTQIVKRVIPKKEADKVEKLEEEDLNAAEKDIAADDRAINGETKRTSTRVSQDAGSEDKTLSAKRANADKESEDKQIQAKAIAQGRKSEDGQKSDAQSRGDESTETAIASRKSDSSSGTERGQGGSQEGKREAKSQREDDRAVARDNGKKEDSEKLAMVQTRPAEPVKKSESEESNEPVLRKPKSNSVLVMPDRALAGQNMTVALLDEKRNPEPNVEICFNGLSLQTDNNGQVVYQVPEDATPGRSLNIAMPSRSEDLPAVVDVLHPLNFDQSTRQAPRLDRTNPLMTLGKRTMIVDGHNFDGMAQNNRIIIDGALEAQIIAASPVQLRFTVPAGTLKPGQHSLVVSTEGMRSNPVPFEFASVEIPADGQNGKDGSKLTVKVLGTTSKVTVKITNLSPDIVRLSHDADDDIVSSGGIDNKAVVPLQRIKKGNYKLQADIQL